MIVSLHLLPSSLFWNIKVIIKIRAKNLLRKVDLKLINLIKIKVSSKITKTRKNQLITDKHKDF
jgi:hypothetical protein